MELKRPRMESVAVTEEGIGLDAEDWIDGEASYEAANADVSDADDSLMDTRELFICEVLHMVQKNHFTLDLEC